MQQPALFMPPIAPSMGDMYEPISIRFDAAELDVGYEVAFPFLLTEPDSVGD